MVGFAVIIDRRWVWPVRIGIGLALLILALVLQTAVFNRIPFFGVRPDLIMVTTFSIAYVRGPVQGGVYGFVGGLLADVFTGHLIGLGAVSTGIVAVAAGLLGMRLVQESVLPVFFLVIAATFVHELIWALGVRAFGIPFPILQGLLAIAPPLMLYNAVLSLLLHRRLTRLSHYIEESASAAARTVVSR